MRIEVVQVQQTTSLHPLVRFFTEYGPYPIEGWWMSNTIPLVNEVYRVEFDIPEDLVGGTTLNPAERSEFYVGMKGSTVVFAGILAAVQENDLIFLRVGESLLLLSAAGDLPPVGTFVEVKGSELGVYDID